MPPIGSKLPAPAGDSTIKFCVIGCGGRGRGAAAQIMTSPHPTKLVAMADAFGPSLHLLILDLFALDIFYAFGFAPVGFDHNISFSLQTVF